MFSIPHAIFTEAFLAFIGLGVPEPMASLGSLIIHFSGWELYKPSVHDRVPVNCHGT